MRWFKHFSNSMDDLFIIDIEREFGDTGYAFWWKTLELIASQGTDGKLVISWLTYQEKLHKRRTVVEQLLNFCSTSGKLLWKTVGEKLEIECPKFVELADNYTKYDGLSSKRLQRQEEMSSKQEEEVEEEVEEKKKRVHTRSLFVVPSQEELSSYGIEIQLPQSEVEAFFDYFQSNGWKVGGKAPMKDWKSALRNWKRRLGTFAPKKKTVAEEKAEKLQRLKKLMGEA